MSSVVPTAEVVSAAEAAGLRAAAASARVLVIGSLNVDLILVAGEEPPDEGAVTVESAQTHVGGHAGNCSAALAALGLAVSVAGAVGTDADGDVIIADLLARGVDVSRVLRCPDRPTGRVVIPVFGERHYMLLVRGANDAFGGEELAAALAEEFDAVMLFDPGLQALQRVGRTAGLLCWTPGGVYSADPVAAHLAPQCDVVFVNQAEHRRLAVDVPGELVVTLGAEGSVWRHRGQEVLAPARRVPVVDPTGAGDAFAASYLLAQLAGLPPRSRLAVGNASGALVVGAMGARSRLPTLTDLLGHHPGEGGGPP